MNAVAAGFECAVHLPHCRFAIGKEHERLLAKDNVEPRVGDGEIEGVALQELNLLDVCRHLPSYFKHAGVQFHFCDMTELADMPGGVA